MKKYMGMLLGVLGLMAVAWGFKLYTSGQAVIIGGADGPTAIYVAGKIGTGSVLAVTAVGVILLAAGICRNPSGVLSEADIWRGLGI